jgi:spermidine synthase
MPTFVRQPDIKLEYDDCLFHEMMAHPAIFTHPQPRIVAVLDRDIGILNEVLKHRCVTAAHWMNKNTQNTFHDDTRVKHQPLAHSQWLRQQPEMFDVIIQTESPENIGTETFETYFQALKNDGVFIQSVAISYLKLDELKPIYHHLDQAGFKDWQLLTFPQPSHPFGLRVAVMASKAIVFKQISEKAIFNRGFPTHYYNFDMHKAALALPQYLRTDLE